ncbi:hypothetical protein M0802_005782 [Mischocyttarus mexicanus]|nr:hypothetical protein M0802_005782 [Mischocyttarus mexicanus]
MKEEEGGGGGGGARKDLIVVTVTTDRPPLSLRIEQRHEVYEETCLLRPIISSFFNVTTNPVIHPRHHAQPQPHTHPRTLAYILIPPCNDFDSKKAQHPGFCTHAARTLPLPAVSV